MSTVGALCQTRVVYLGPIKMARKTTQLTIHYPAGWGGRRAGAGRKRQGSRKRVPHRARPKLASRFPVHVTVRMLGGLPRLRGFDSAKVLRRAFVHGCKHDGFRICQFSVQGNHIHLICEAKNNRALARGIQMWKTRVTKGFNRHWRLSRGWLRKGTVFDDRYHSEIMKSPRQVRAGICYVMQNARRHGITLPAWAHGIDPFSSACYFDGWRDQRWRKGLPPPVPDPDAGKPPVALAHTWLLTQGWRRHSLIGPTEVPAAVAPRNRSTRPPRR